MPISTIDGVAWSSLSSFGGVAKANIASVNGVTGAPPYIFAEDCESGTVPNGWTNGGANWAYTPAIIGNYSLNASGGGAYYLFNSESEVWFFSAIVILSFAGSPILAELKDPSNTFVARIQVSSGQTWMLNGGSATNWILSPNTTYYVWWHYKRGTGSNAIHELFYSTTQTRPVSPLLSTYTGTTQLNVGRIAVAAGVYDKMRLLNAEIGSNPI